ncbi:hypothetical protein [Mycobacteroides abscessus]|uniref:hypothetical protein n=1 Tax=Mycobacteroides abscessus TaxID=36809 RepID=UPI0009C80425|nr:hypothetical protein [Mycobacteroides abscessus]SKK27464.1 Uncharacterised protein [Mycobacteroides abscessus subsp. massiliense]SKK31117.1 Uncharacterised protein [Mycobacteroides abscessus subsp. massiliense]SKK52041.1 Uncharacterised protein [Mycobacteroides abscessus subsp. massiliense]
MSSDYPDVVDLDRDSAAAAPVSNTSWAARLFNDDAAPEPEPDRAPEPDTGATVSVDVAAASEPSGEPAPPVASLTSGDGQPMDFAALSQLMSGLPGAHDVPEADTDDPHARAGAAWSAFLGGAAAVSSAIIIAATVLTWADPPPPPKEDSVPVLVAGAPTIEPQAVPVADDIDVPYWAHDPSCYNGNDSDPNAMRQNTTNAVWNCLRGFGGSGGGVDGHTVTVSFGDERNGAQWYLVSEIAMTPGWVPKVPGGEDEWDGHRVPTRVRYIFNDSPDPTRQTKWDVNTNNHRGPVPYRGVRPVLASQVTIVILETSRPPQQDIAGSTNSPNSPDFPGMPGSRGPRSTSRDDEITPADATFAVSALQVKGHVPG